ncbi:MAG: hypothetical protein JW950_01790 [Deltaproteobacteria bacterium]|nr:hypothetical protein [Deltaproteobacteria bacterium]
MKLKYVSKGICITLLLFILFCLTSCTTIHFKTIPPPPKSTKLRVAILPITENMGLNPFIPSTEWVPLMFKLVGENLRDTGIYEVVPQEEVNSVMSEQDLVGAEEYWWLRNDCALLKQYGKALHADYGILIRRRAQMPASRLSGYAYRLEFINIETGMRYSASDNVANTGHFESTRDIVIKMWPDLYRKLFSDAKGDLLATALRKGQLMPTKEMMINKKAKSDVESVLTSSGILKAKEPSPVVEKPPMTRSEKKPGDGLQSQMPSTDKTRIVVYDFDADENLHVVALILTDALREVILRFGLFSLVNRENIMQVSQELKLEQSGLVREKQIAKLGQWLAVNEAITGRINALGNSYILQAKRTNIETMETLGAGTLKCSRGQEEELLSGISVLARSLIGLEE